MGVRGCAPSMAGGPCRPRSSSKSIAPNREPLVFGTNSGSINEPLIGGSFFVGNGEGIEALCIASSGLRKKIERLRKNPFWRIIVRGVRGGCKGVASRLKYRFNLAARGRQLRKHFNAVREDSGRCTVSLYTQGVSRILRSYILASGRNWTVGSA